MDWSGMRAAILMTALTLALSGCAGQPFGRGLVPGQATETEVEKVMGPSADRRQKPGGETIRYYPRMPHGREVYAARFGADGKLIAIEQRLTAENVTSLKPGVSKADDVRDLLGPPYRISQFALSNREVWDYPMKGLIYPRRAHVEFSPDKVVREVVILDDTDDPI
jgi:hypothetical protein